MSEPAHEELMLDCECSPENGYVDHYECPIAVGAALAAVRAELAAMPSEADLRLFVTSACRYESRVYHIEQYPWARRFLTDEDLADNSKHPREYRIEAEAERDALAARIAAASALHYDEDGFCHECSSDDSGLAWPCATARALRSSTGTEMAQ